MRVRTLDELSDQVLTDLAWRKKELMILRNLIEKKRNSACVVTLVRASHAVLYAHWEVLVKNAGTAYAAYVFARRNGFSELSPCFVALALRTQLRQCSVSSKADRYLELVKYMMDGMNSTPSVSAKNAVDSESNLSSSVLRNILSYLGLDYGPYQTREKLIDESLLKVRNEVAHGRGVTSEAQRYLDLQDEVVKLMELLVDQVLDAASKKQYLSRFIAQV